MIGHILRRQYFGNRILQFVSPTGVGKTYTSLGYAEKLLGDPCHNEVVSPSFEHETMVGQYVLDPSLGEFVMNYDTPTLEILGGRGCLINDEVNTKGDAHGIAQPSYFFIQHARGQDRIFLAENPNPGESASVRSVRNSAHNMVLANVNDKQSHGGRYDMAEEFDALVDSVYLDGQYEEADYAMQVKFVLEGAVSIQQQQRIARILQGIQERLTQAINEGTTFYDSNGVVLSFRELIRLLGDFKAALKSKSDQGQGILCHPREGGDPVINKLLLEVIEDMYLSSWDTKDDYDKARSLIEEVIEKEFTDFEGFPAKNFDHVCNQVERVIERRQKQVKASGRGVVTPIIVRASVDSRAGDIVPELCRRLDVDMSGDQYEREDIVGMEDIEEFTKGLSVDTGVLAADLGKAEQSEKLNCFYKNAPGVFVRNILKAMKEPEKNFVVELWGLEYMLHHISIALNEFFQNGYVMYEGRQLKVPANLIFLSVAHAPLQGSPAEQSRFQRFLLFDTTPTEKRMLLSRVLEEGSGIKALPGVQEEASPSQSRGIFVDVQQQQEFLDEVLETFARLRKQTEDDPDIEVQIFDSLALHTMRYIGFLLGEGYVLEDAWDKAKEFYCGSLALAGKQRGEPWDSLGQHERDRQGFSWLEQLTNALGIKDGTQDLYGTAVSVFDIFYQYMKWGKQRCGHVFELADRLRDNPGRIADLGCGDMFTYRARRYIYVGRDKQNVVAIGTSEQEEGSYRIFSMTETRDVVSIVRKAAIREYVRRRRIAQGVECSADRKEKKQEDSVRSS